MEKFIVITYVAVNLPYMFRYWGWFGTEWVDLENRRSARINKLGERGILKTIIEESDDTLTGSSQYDAKKLLFFMYFPRLITQSLNLFMLFGLVSVLEKQSINEIIGLLNTPLIIIIVVFFFGSPAVMLYGLLREYRDDELMESKLKEWDKSDM